MRRSVDPANRLLWRMNPRRLDIEAYRDCILQASGNLDERMAGPSGDLDQTGNKRRTVYARVSRGRLSTVLQLYDFPEATMHSPQREITTTPLQQLFVMNSPFMRDRAAALAKSVAEEPDAEREGSRHVSPGVRPRSRRTRTRLGGRVSREVGTLAEYAQALLCTNEVIFWP